MNASNSNNERFFRFPRLNQVVRNGIETETRRKTKKSVSRLNLSNEVGQTEKSRAYYTKQSGTSNLYSTEVTETQYSDVGIQVNAAEIIEINIEQYNEKAGEVTQNIRVLPDKVVEEIEGERQIKKKHQLKETILEEQQIHLNNLNEFLETGKISLRPRRTPESNNSYIRSNFKVVSQKTNEALEAYNRIKRKERELLSMFNKC